MRPETAAGPLGAFLVTPRQKSPSASRTPLASVEPANVLPLGGKNAVKADPTGPILLGGNIADKIEPEALPLGGKSADMVESSESSKDQDTVNMEIDSPKIASYSPERHSLAESNTKSGKSSTNSTPARKKVKTEHVRKSDFVVEFKNRKLVFHECRLDLDKLADTLTEIVVFRKFCEDPDCKADLDTFPESFLPLLAKLIQDSEKTLVPLVKEVKGVLCPGGQAAKIKSTKQLSTQAIKTAIEKISTRHDYGVVLPTTSNDQTSLPHTLSIFRREVNDISLLPDNLHAEIMERRRRRELASRQATELFQSFGQSQRDEMINKQKNVKKNDLDAAEKLKAKEIEAAAKIAEKERKAEEKRTAKEKKEAEKRAAVIAKGTEQLKRPEGREKKTQTTLMRGNQNQTSISMFLTPKKKAEKETPQAGNSPAALFFEQYRPFHVKVDAAIAPINKFHHTLPENFDDESGINQGPKSIAEDSRGLLHTFLQTVSRRYPQNRRHRQQAVRPSLRELVVREGDTVDAKLSKAEFQANGVSIKLLQFAEDFRPPYWGTFTKPSTRLKARRPFDQDPNLFDYEYDSEAEWEEDEEGEECVSGDEDEPEEVDAEVDPTEDDDWLVPHGYLSDDEGIDDHGSSNGEVSPKKPKVNEKSEPQRRPIISVTPLIPIIVGPIFTDTYDGASPDVLLESLRIEVFAEISLPVNPYISVMNTEEPKCAKEEPEGEVKRRRRRDAFPEEGLAELVQMLDQSDAGIQKMVETVKAVFPGVAKKQIENKIREIAVKEKRGSDQKPVWHVQNQVLASLGATTVTESSPSAAAPTIKSIFRNLADKSNTKQPFLPPTPIEHSVTQQTGISVEEDVLMEDAL